MDTGTMVLTSIFLFFIVYLAVRVAIQPLINDPYKIVKDNKESELIRLRDIEVISNDELEEIIGIYKSKGIWKENYEQYQKYAKILKALKEMDYLNEEQYSIKLDKLRGYFRIE